MKRFRQIISILNRTEKSKFYTLLVLDAISSVLDIAFLVILLYVIGFYTGNTREISAVIDPYFFNQYPLLLIGSFLFLFTIKNLFGFFVTKTQLKFLYHVASRISQEKLNEYLDGSYEDYVSVASSVHIRRISQQPVEFVYYAVRGSQQVISSVILILAATIPLMIYKPMLFLMILLVLLPPALLLGLIMKNKLASIRDNNKKNREKTMQHLQEALSGYIEINLLDQKNYFIERFRIYQEKFNESLAALQATQSLPSRLMEVFAVLGLFVLVVASTVIDETRSINVLLVGGFMAAAYKIIPGIVKLLNAREQIRTYSYTIDELYKQEDAALTSFDKGGAQPNNETLESIGFLNVNFAYQGKVVLNSFSMELNKGDFAGLSGDSGKGKTTIVHLLLGFLEPQSGTISFNGNVLNADQRKKWWKRISYSRQQQFILHESLKDNISLGRQLDEQAYAAILDQTGLRDWGEILMAESGKNISGGQRQRVIFARTLLADADVYILDEPFNELDRTTANEFLSRISSLSKQGRIILLVAHDRESFGYCNKIISLDEN